MKKILGYIFILLITIFTINLNVKAEDIKLYVNLEKLNYSKDNKTYSNIKEYETLDDFLEDYNSSKLPDIYITDFLFDGVSTVKTPDLDDFIENDSNDTKIKTLEIRTININTTGNIELKGKTKGTMIGINTNNVKEDINLILNNVNIDTDSKKAPAIYVYNKDTKYTDCKVTIKTKKVTKNYIEGGKLKKVSLLEKNNLDTYKSNYNNDLLTNYEKYTSYYGIYSSNELDKILFAKVKADNEDLQEGDPLYFYKASGAISSDIDLYFEGEGYLEVNSKNKEGIETKGNLSLIGGTGDYAVYAYDDCLNTTTSKTAGQNVRNTMTIDVNSLVAIVNDEGDEGDAIDSNGTLTINGGKIYAFAHSTSGDAGLDSEDGTYINGGEIIATGNMSDQISSESKQNYLYINFNQKIEKDTLLVIKNQKDEILVAFKTKKTISNLLYSNNNLNYKTLKVYKNGEIDGEKTNGLYTKINSYKEGEEVSYSLVENNKNINNSNKFILYYFLTSLTLLIIVILIYTFMDYKKLKFEK